MTEFVAFTYLVLADKQQHVLSGRAPLHISDMYLTAGYVLFNFVLVVFTIICHRTYGTGPNR